MKRLIQDLCATRVVMRVENTRTDLLAQWLVENWPQGGKKIDADGQVRPSAMWQWPLGDPRGRRLEVLPLRVTEKNSAKVVLAVHVLEYETDLPQPPTYREYRPGDPQRLVLDNPRGIEITLRQVELAAVEMTALCTTTVVLGDYTALLNRARQTYGPSLRLATAHIGRMDGLHGEGVFLWHRLDGVIVKHYAEELAALLKEIAPSTPPAYDKREANPRLEYIRANYCDKTDAEMGEVLSLDADTIKKLRLAHGLRKRRPRRQT